MSYEGRNPSYAWLTVEPRAVDPTSPNEGDIFYSDGTPRDEGLWVYQNGAWEQISTSGNLSVLTNLTLTPQAADPGSPVNGMLFTSDGTSRAAGLWFYDGTDWIQLTGVRYQEFIPKTLQVVRVASTANGIMATDFDNGSVLDGITLATGDIILIKNQTTASDNGVYTVQASGVPLRLANADTASELNRYGVAVTIGTANKSTQWFQTATLSSLSDPQTWATTPATYSWTAPEGVYSVDFEIAAGGGGGAGGTFNAGLASTNGSAGGNSSFGSILTVYGASGGAHGSGSTGGVAGTSAPDIYGMFNVAGGAGGSTANGDPGQVSIWAQTASVGGTKAAGTNGGGGGGGNGRATGANGGNGIASGVPVTSAPAAAASSAGGGGGGGSATPAAGGAGGNGSMPIFGTFKVTPGVSYTISIGPGGNGGLGQNAASNIARGGHGGMGGSGYLRLSW